MKYSVITLSILFILQIPIVYAEEKSELSTEVTEVIEISGRAIQNHNISPKNAMVNGPFGDDLGLGDIARSITPITQEMMEQLNITSLQDI